MSAHESLEVELKFDVDVDHPVPDLAALVPDGSVAQPQRFELRATYLDTIGHDLAARKITLRRRTGGTDAGWHLKRPGKAFGSGTVRRELAVPFTDPSTDPAEQEVPAAIRHAIMAIVRDRDLIPVAEITSERTVTVLRDAQGTSLAEFCQDRVISHAHQSQHTQEWAEWEFELTGGGKKLLKAADKLLGSAGARPAVSSSKLARAIGTEPHVHAPGTLPKKPTALDFLVHTVGEHVTALVATDPLVRENAWDAVHQMRVNSRRLRSILTSFPQIADPDSTAGLTAELQALGEVLGEARDREVQLEINTRLLAGEHDVPEQLQAVLIDDEIARQERALRSVRYAMSTSRYLRLLDALDDLVANPVPGPDAARRADKVADEGLAAARTRLRKAEKKLSALPPWSPDWVAQVHRIRRRAKAVRYTAGAVAGLDHPRAGKVGKRAARIQSLLGDFQDTVINREQIARAAQTPDLPPRALLILGRLDEREEQRGRTAVQTYLAER
ncbi:hypothetical protein GOHSU_16_00260 [Gordonia hirsuta DSM 44140 = NBRC 16056]|uniref:CHAD domain-containing protein n=1 Tax=Gordonia hirsuta DSM 44140 = NBRC 16056 TaxID=1121927 RepID=L7L835_9ACTN|nr:CYTH and CHAD domain-containing protein [Gordonia hirsuta]GAC57069.1 hypothetical protein GOHSU_16_00260 [Gordonia hirsuta DSM 44140 = NBRC 16056]